MMTSASASDRLFMGMTAAAALIAAAVSLSTPILGEASGENVIASASTLSAGYDILP